MKKALLSVFIVLINTFLFSQNLKPIPQKVKDYFATGKRVAAYDLFTVNEDQQKQVQYRQAASGITVMKLNKSQISKVVTEKPEAMEMSFPFEGHTVTVELIKHNIFAQGFKVETDKGFVDYTPGVYYQGIVKGDEQSLVAFSFFKDEVMGMASINNVGNIVLGKAQNSEDFVSYNDQRLTKQNPFNCLANTLPENKNYKVDAKKLSSNPAILTQNCPRIFSEMSYDIYQQRGSSVSSTTDWQTAVFNNTKTLYNNDDIQIAMSGVFVWTSNDGYTGGNDTMLYSFQTRKPTFDGDLATLMKPDGSGGIAFLDGLCSNNKYSVCDVNMNYSAVPTFSWTVEVLTHELGHNLGSPHTQACAWNGNDTAIDGCVTTEGGCARPGVPSNGGTIMSYCHFQSVGINFLNGFGPQPKSLIINTIESKGCVGTNCTTSCPVTVENVIPTSITKTTAAFTITDNTATSWKYKVTKMDGTEVASGTTNSKTWNVGGLTEGTYYKVFVGTIGCSASTAYQSESLILTDANWCSGVLFRDSGGENLNYEHNQTLVKTFYPDTPGRRVKLTFSQFNIEERDPSTNVLYDYMDVYNGTSINAPKFPNGSELNGNTIPGPFTATNPDGAITVRFISDGGLELSGWTAAIDCSLLSTNDINAQESITLSPNPTKGEFVINSKNPIISYEIHDASGRLINKDSQLKATKQKIDLSKKKSGTYLITIKTDNETVTKKIIKN